MLKLLQALLPSRRLLAELRGLRLAVERLTSLYEASLRYSAASPPEAGARSRPMLVLPPRDSKTRRERSEGPPEGLNVSDSDLIRWAEAEEKFFEAHGRYPYQHEDPEKDL